MLQKAEGGGGTSDRLPVASMPSQGGYSGILVTGMREINEVKLLDPKKVQRPRT